MSYAVDEHNRDLISDDLIASVEMLKAAIIAGEVDVPNTGFTATSIATMSGNGVSMNMIRTSVYLLLLKLNHHGRLSLLMIRLYQKLLMA